MISDSFLWLARFLSNFQRVKIARVKIAIFVRYFVLDSCFIISLCFHLLHSIRRTMTTTMYQGNYRSGATTYEPVDKRGFLKKYLEPGFFDSNFEI